MRPEIIKQYLDDGYTINIVKKKRKMTILQMRDSIIDVTNVVGHWYENVYEIHCEHENGDYDSHTKNVDEFDELMEAFNTFGFPKEKESDR